ncbi:hypothetical protein [Hyphomonas sp.]|uniref:hypothetical protein n=1 Tax=Hyphomonas sp. TaxID=87 RepID=UPI00391D680F
MSLSSSGEGRVQYTNSNISGDKATFSNVTLSSPALSRDSGWDEPPVVTAETLEFDGLGMFNGQANFGLMRLNNIRITPAPDAEDQTSGTIKYIELINPSAETAAWVASLFGQGEPADFPEGAALSFDRWAVGDVNLTVDDASGTGRFTLASFYIASLGLEKSGKVGLSDLVFTFAGEEESDVNVRLEGFGVSGIDYGLLLAAANSSEDPMAISSALQADPSNPGFDAISIRGFKADVAGAAIDLPRMTSAVSRDPQGRATRFKTDPFTISLAARDNPDGEELAAMLAMLGYEAMQMRIASDQAYDPETDILSLAKDANFIELVDGFRLDFGAKYAGSRALAAASAFAETDPDAVLASVMSDLKFFELSLVLKDNGFFNRALNAYGTMSGEDPQQVRQMMVGALAFAPMFASGTGIDAPVVTELAGALSSFVQDPKTLSIRFAPATPLTPQVLIDASADPSFKLTKETLGFSADNR